MKQILLILSLVVLTSSTAFAQETVEQVESKTTIVDEGTSTITEKQIKPKKEILKAQKGDFNVELMFNPLNFNGGTFGLDGLRARVFCSDKIALRLHIGISAGDTLYNIKGYNSRDDIERKTVGGLFAFSFVPGMEFHLGNMRNLSPYVGFDLGVGWARAFNNGYTGFMFTVGAICGVDFYVYKGLYLGAEFALRYNLNTITFEFDNELRISTSEFGFIPVPSIRLGWKF